jgi:hypothetical protein
MPVDRHDVPKEEQILISERNVLSTFAANAVAQSPYHRPDSLERAIDALRDKVKPAFDAVPKEHLGFITTDARGLRGWITEEFLMEIPEVAAWNERRNGNQAPYGFSSRYDEPHPDDDFIDIGALARNICNDIIAKNEKARLFDAEFEQRHKRENMTFGEAVEALKRGEKVARAIWGGYWVAEMVQIVDHRIGARDEYNDMIVAHLKDNGGIAPAQPYQADLLATDWKIID